MFFCSGALHLQQAAEGDARDADVDQARLAVGVVRAAGGGLLALVVEQVVDADQKRDADFRATREQAQSAVGKDALEQAGEDTGGNVGGVAGLRDRVAAAKLGVGAADIASLADCGRGGDGEAVVTRVAILGHGGGDGADGQTKSSEDGGDTHSERVVRVGAIKLLVCWKECEEL